MAINSVEISSDINSTRLLNKEIKKELNANNKDICIKNNNKLNSIVVGIREESNFTLDGDFGDFIGALNDGAIIKLTGSSGRYVGNNMTNGEIIVNGSVSDGVGFGLSDGTIVIKGDAGDAVGQLNKGGTILIDGNIGDLSGLYMLSGNIIVTGNAGKDTGDWMIGGNMYVQGSYQPGYNVKEIEMSQEDIDKLQSIFLKYNINADAKNFKKLGKEKLRPFYG